MKHWLLARLGEQPVPACAGTLTVLVDEGQAVGLCQGTQFCIEAGVRRWGRGVGGLCSDSPGSQSLGEGPFAVTASIVRRFISHSRLEGEDTHGYTKIDEGFVPWD